MQAENSRHIRPRVVITGMGAISSLGNNLASTWQGLVEGRCGVGPITAFDASRYLTRIAAEVKDFDARDYMDRRDARRTSAFIHYALAAAREALAAADLDLDREDKTRVGLEIGSALGGVQVTEEGRLLLEQRGPRAINPTLLPAVLINMAPCYLAIHFGIQGPASSTVTACTTGISAIGEAMRRVAWGDADVMIAGGSESIITPLAIASFSRLGALSTRNDTPERAITPFDAERDGTVLGEGAAVVVLESLDHALGRGAKILAEVVGYALTVDAYHLAKPDPGGLAAARAMTQALREAGLTAASLDYIAAHGTGTILNDAAETTALKAALGQRAYHIPVSSVKSMTGHMLGASGAMSVVSIVQAMQTGWLPPTAGYERPDPACDLDYVPNQARKLDVSVGMANSSGFGGQNASLVLKRWES
ncbi:MAG: beta-ketoacyl-ACP synthase II [Anaerolineae bacterium]